MANFEPTKETVSGSVSFDLQGFTERMGQIPGDESARSFGWSCGLSDTAIKKYRAGTSTPNVERLIALAWMCGVLLVKRLQPELMGGFCIKSDNPAYREIHISPSNKPDDIRIIAKWTGKKI
ncbi:S24 family peptidase [uncultured Oceanisphaera sp.]|uniref:S24 family peptidase n=1 Tax=uncultured Oceanisphaera sp. TaxID=353858 RepID=UPI00261C8348|nr:S24 family peptidase [uncultured Oceanisphaera sp.]